MSGAISERRPYDLERVNQSSTDSNRRRSSTRLNDAPPHARARSRRLAHLRLSFALLIALFLPSLVTAAEVIPPAPPNHFNDFAGVVSPATAAQLDRELTDFERATSNQIVVAVYPTMQSDSSIEDYAVRLYQAWHIGEKGRNNGALVLVFTQTHRMRIATGYGLEGALPDALCARIMDHEMAPHFRQGDYAGGLEAGIQAIIAATKGEYQGTGRTAADQNRGGNSSAIPTLLFIGFIILVTVLQRRSRSVAYGRRGRSSTWIGPTWWGGGGGWGGGSWGGGGGGWSGGGGSFSGGGGSTGGGGASGSW